MDTPILIIEAGKTEKQYWKDIFRYRELFYILSWRDLKVRYKQTAIGVAWSVIRPLLMMAIFTVVFSRVAKLPSDANAPYAIMVFAALLPWQFFANSLSESSGSLINNVNLVSKVYFPRLIIPTSSVIVSLVDFLISFGLLIVLMVFYRYTPSWHIVFVPVFLVLAFLASFGVGTYMTALNVKYRDFRYIVPFIVQFGLYISPVGFSSSVVPKKWWLWYSLNPMVGIIDGFRWCILGNENSTFALSLALSLTVSTIVAVFAVRYFRKTEKTFADII